MCVMWLPRSLAGQISSVFWLIHSDLHEIKATAVLEYMSSMVASLELINKPANGENGKLENLFSIEHNSGRGKFNVRLKRRNGRVKVLVSSLFLLCLSCQIFLLG